MIKRRLPGDEGDVSEMSVVSRGMPARMPALRANADPATIVFRASRHRQSNPYRLQAASWYGSRTTVAVSFVPMKAGDDPIGFMPARRRAGRATVTLLGVGLTR